MCYHNVHVITISVAGGFAYGQLGMSHHATEDIGMMSILPNMAVLAPATPMEAREAFHWAIKHKGPSYIRLFRRGEPALYETTVRDIYQPRSVCYEAGARVALLCSGPILGNVILAQKFLMSKGIKANVWSVPCIKPLNAKVIEEILKNYDLVATVEEHQIHGGFGGIVCEIAAESRMKLARILRLGLKDEFTSVVGNHEYLCDYYGLSAEKIAKSVEMALE